MTEATLVRSHLVETNLRGLTELLGPTAQASSAAFAVEIASTKAETASAEEDYKR